ncbi:MAG: helix-turn-helix transcriptional regulator [Bacilli bacterium]|nr:helix-turn-helix transcriptional regulator [Bacilli bacterium]
MKFGEKLYNLRKNANMSQETLAEKLDVSRQSISKWENGNAYPEMNRIIELCKIFRCNINELINENIIDFDSLDEEVKMNVVKFNKEKQAKLKLTSKIISVLSKVISYVALIASIGVAILTFFTPMIINNTKVLNGKIQIYGNEFSSNQTAQLIEIINDNSNTQLIIYSIIICVCLIVTIMLLFFAFKYLSKLFDNINKDNTPFTLDNLNLIKKITYLLIGYSIFPEISGYLYQFITKIDMGIEIEGFKFVFILIMICIYYVFDYGHQIQLDSKGIIYGKES